MVSAIVSCPKCQTLVLSDTIQCPSCHHVLIEDQAKAIGVQAAQTAPQETSSQEEPCKECGVMVRKGVVRCFNCGSFTNPEIEAKFLVKQENQAPIMYSDLPVANAKVNSSSETSLNKRPVLPVEEEEEDDFELDDSLEMTDSDDESIDFSSTLDEMDFEVNDEEPVEAIDVSAVAEPDATFSDRDDSGDVNEEDDQLFSIAMQEEAELASRKRRQDQTSKKQVAKFIKATPDGIVMLPPCRCCAIRIQPEQLGGNGVCPKCKLTFRIPSPKIQARVIPSSSTVSTAVAKNVDHRFTGTAVVQLKGGYHVWLNQLWLHTIETAKFKPVEDYLPKHYVPVDVGFSPDVVSAFPLAKKPGTYSADDAKLIEARNKYLAKLTENNSAASLTELDAVVISLNQLAQLKLIDPITAPSTEFGTVNIWGEGRIYLEIPPVENADRRQFLSMTISQYREFCRIVAHIYGYTAFADKGAVPQKDKMVDLTCMFSKRDYRTIQNEKYYQNDPLYKLTLVGYSCESCGKFLSEESRTDKKLGSAANKAPAKMKCLACGKKFGEHPRYDLAGEAEEKDPKKKKPVKANAK
ncbi:hypothetical protein [Lacunimicrobium album]